MKNLQNPFRIYWVLPVCLSEAGVFKKQKSMKNPVEVGDTHRDFSKSMAKGLPLVVLLECL